MSLSRIRHAISLATVKHAEFCLNDHLIDAGWTHSSDSIRCRKCGFYITGLIKSAKKHLPPLPWEDVYKASSVTYARRAIMWETRFRQSRSEGLYKVEALYKEYLQSNDWAERRWQTLSQRPKCERCGKKASVVHHKTYGHVGNEPAEDLMSVCASCHRIEHAKNKIRFSNEALISSSPELSMGAGI